MAVNYEVWGTPEQWCNPNPGSGYEAIEAKLPKATADSYYDIYYNNLVPLNEIDISNCFWGISKNSLFLSLKYISPYINNDNVNVDIRDVYEEQIDRPAIFTATPNGRSQSYHHRYSPDRSSAPPDSAIYFRGVVMAFNYQKVKTTPFVAVRATPQSNAQTIYRLDQYITDNKYVNYPYIVAIGYYVSYNGGNPAYDLSLATIGHVKGYNVHYGSNLFYARSSGIDSFLTSWRETNGSVNYLCQSFILSENINYNIGDSETAFAYKYSIGEQTQPKIYNYDGDPLWELYTDYMDGSTRKYCVGYAIHATADNINDVRDYLFKQMAYIGLPFYYLDSDKSKHIGDSGVYLPKFDINGITTGEYAEGAAALNLPNSEWTDGRTGSGYDPTRRPGNDDYGYLINPFNSNRFTTGLNVWCMYQQDILDVLAGINNLYLTDPAGNEKWQLDFKGSNPDDYIVSCKAMLLNIAHSDTTSAFKLGPVQFDGIACYKYNGTGSFSFGTIPLDGTGDYTPYGDFRDYQPYTTMELYIPLCGTVEIDPEFFVGHSIEIIMMYDIYTGACTAGIYRDNFTLYKAVNGQIGADIPVSAMQMGTYQNSVHALQAAQKQNEIRLASSAVTVAAGAAALIAAPATGGTSLIAGVGLITGAAGLLGGVMQEQNYDYQIEHTQPIPAQTTAAETQNNFCVGGLYPILYVKRAKMLQGYDAEIYSHTIGNACLINGQVGSQTGLVICSSVDLSGVPATVEEINAIKQALGKGVYV